MRRYRGIAAIFSVFLMIAAVLFMERSGIRYTIGVQESPYLEREQAITAKEAKESLPKVCLALTDSENRGSQNLEKQFEQIFLDMKVGYDRIDVRSLKDGEKLPFDRYETVVVMVSDLSTLGERVLDLCSWVKQGGDVLFAMTLERESYLMMIEQKLGIISAGYSYAVVKNVFPSKDYMVGGGQAYNITDPFDSAWAVELAEEAELLAWSDEERSIPLVWEKQYGDGRFVIVNLGYYERAFRGFYAAAYSRLTECIAYPVINGSAFYLDDFPSPVPSGNGFYIMRDYGVSIDEFYTNIWWPDMMALAKKYGIRYTGVIIENYEDKTDGTTISNEDIAQFQYFGNMLLRQNGEIGYHGYNHQPFSLANVDYEGILPYDTWDSYESMVNAMTELVDFSEKSFPGTVKSVYVPPSNVLSPEGREMLVKEFPDVRTIASNYMSGDFVYQQEFEVAEDGMVEQPRIIAGGILDDYMRMCALSELNMHFVNNHFLHPDDLLDEDRGAELGWETLKGNLDHYMNWLYTNAPQIRNMTASELSGAVQRFAAVTVEREIEADKITFRIGNLYDEAYFMVRFNEKTPGKVTGGALEHITGNLYLMRADQPEVQVEMDR